MNLPVFLDQVEEETRIKRVVEVSQALCAHGWREVLDLSVRIKDPKKGNEVLSCLVQCDTLGYFLDRIKYKSKDGFIYRERSKK